MSLEYVHEKTFSNEDFTATTLQPTEFENCTFVSCNFSGTDLSRFIFDGCEFRSCNLSLAKLVGTALRNITMKDCKMLGLHFDDCNSFGFSLKLDTCTANHSTFHGMRLKNAVFKNTRLEEADFSNADLAGATFLGCDLVGAMFDNTNLEKTDFRGARNYSINPSNNKLKKAKFSLPDVVGLLHHLDVDIES